MSRAQTYRLNDFNTLDLTEEDGSTATAVAGIQDVAITPSVSIEHLMTADSIKAADRMQHDFTVDVQIGYSFFDGAVVDQWLGGAGGTTAAAMTDTSDPQTYQIAGEFDSADGSNRISATVTAITFPEMPILDAAQGEFAQWDLQGTGEDLTGFGVAAPP